MHRNPSKYVETHGGTSIMLGVVEDNRAAYNFWQRSGFALQSKTEPRQFGRKVQAVYVMKKTV